MLKHSLTLLAILGVLIALFSFGVDYLLPGTSPGFNLPQLLIVGAGLALTLVATQLRRQDRRRRLAGLRGKAFAAAAIITLLTLLVLEIVLTIWGMPTYFPSEVSIAEVEVAPWWICDELGCHYLYEEIHAACANGVFSGRHCVVNRQGFGDSEDFEVGEDFADRARILMLGDSFTQGFSADVGKSYVETLEATLPEVVVWNTAISGSGTSQALATFKEFAPKLKPQLTILGFYTNDFLDNLRAFDGWMRLRDADGRQYKIRRFQYDIWGNPIELPPEVVYAYNSLGYNAPVNNFERATGLTRLGTLAFRLSDMLSNRTDHDSLARQYQLTSNFLIELRDAAAAQTSQFVVLLIPHRLDIGNLGEHYRLAVQLMDELNIAYMNPIDMLDPVADYAPESDVHLNNAGHQKVGAYLSECVDRRLLLAETLRTAKT